MSQKTAPRNFFYNFVKPFSEWYLYNQGSHASLKVLEFFSPKFKALKVLEKEDRCLKVLEFHSTGP